MAYNKCNRNTFRAIHKNGGYRGPLAIHKSAGFHSRRKIINWQSKKFVYNRNDLVEGKCNTFLRLRRVYSRLRDSMGTARRAYSNTNQYGYWERLRDSLGIYGWKKSFHGKIYAYIKFIEPYHRIIDFEVLTYGFIILLEQYAYNIKSKYVKFTMGYIMKLPGKQELVCTLGKAIPLYDTFGNILPKKMIYFNVEQLVRLYGEKYQDAVIEGIFINLYYDIDQTENLKSDFFPTNLSFQMIVDIIKVQSSSSILNTNLPDVKSHKHKNARISYKINALKASYKEKCRPFIVADIETVLVNSLHVPYAAGYLVVNPGDDLTSIPDYSINTFLSEDHILFYPKFEDRSDIMFSNFLLNLEIYVKSNRQFRTVYFHNFSRFDGIFIMKYYADRGDKYKIKSLMRNHKLYELKVYVGNNLLFRFRDSYTLLPSALDILSKTLCPELGSKGSIPHSDLRVDNLKDHRSDIINYLRQDILLLGGVMKKAQEINWSNYKIDIENVMTVSSLSVKIFRKRYFNDKIFHINIPTRNQDTFIRRGYYGGHVDVYKPYGENLYYYDVNSLYPYVMKHFPMPSGEPVWHNNLEESNLDDLFGFLEAYVVCPSTIEHPFLPYKDKFGTLIFPTGRFTGVFYSEELKFARELGYSVVPLRGYLFEKKPSPFEGIISDLYERRLEAKKRGDAPMTYIYKILMNSLYGRFGMNPESTVTEICTQKRYEELMMQDTFQSAEKLTDHYYIVNYITNSYSLDDEDWKAPRMSAVHLAAAITACARIHMYPHIARSDCYYTDTDSIVIGSPLSDDLVSSTELGKFKLENHVKKGIFLAPKSYMLEMEDEGTILKHKGPAKDLITSDWFQKQYADPSITMQMSTEANFRIDWKKLQIGKKNVNIKLGLSYSSKRDNVYDENEEWVGTRSKNVVELGTQDANTILKYELLNQNEEKDNDKKTKEEEVSQSPTEGQKTKPTLYNTKAQALKAKALKAKAKTEGKKDSKPKPDE